MRRRDAVVYGLVLAAALWLNGTFAQAVPEFHNGAWVLPGQDEPAAAPLAAQGGYSSGVEQWRDEVDAACATYGCSTDYILSVMACERGGDPNAVGPNGELGLMQIQPAIWGYYGPVESIWFAAQHLTAGDIYWACA